jgi:hypothetical protein
MSRPVLVNRRMRLVNMEDLYRTAGEQPFLEAITFTVRDVRQLSIVVSAAERTDCNFTVLDDPERKDVQMVFVKGDQEKLKECVRIVAEL